MLARPAPSTIVIAAMQANHPRLTTTKAFCVGISRARPRAELVTDDARPLKERLDAVTGERIPALEGIGTSIRSERERGQERDGNTSDAWNTRGPEASPSPLPVRDVEPTLSRDKHRNLIRLPAQCGSA